MILQRVFEYDPFKRITIRELRQLILECPRFTVPTTPAPTSGNTGRPQVLPAGYSYYPYSTVPRVELLNAQYSDSAVSDTSLTDDETLSSVSSDSDYASEPEIDNLHVVQPKATAAAPEYWDVGVPIFAPEKVAPLPHLIEPYVAVY
jgi:hypothetical protein